MDDMLYVCEPLWQFTSGEISYDEAFSRLENNLRTAKNRCVEAYVNNETILFENDNRIVILPAGESYRGVSRNVVVPIVNNDGTVDYCWDEEFLRDILSPFDITKDTFDDEYNAALDKMLKEKSVDTGINIFEEFDKEAQ